MGPSDPSPDRDHLVSWTRLPAIEIRAEGVPCGVEITRPVLALRRQVTRSKAERACADTVA